jgi:hypothetical protein
MWYVGSRTARGCHPDDGYICSSKIVKNLIEQNPEEWERTIVETGDPQTMYDLESLILQMFDAKNDPRSFNKHNNEKHLTNLGIPHTKETKQKVSKTRRDRLASGDIVPWNKGLTKDDPRILKHAETQIGKKRPGVGGVPKGTTSWKKGKQVGSAAGLKGWATRRERNRHDST